MRLFLYGTLQDPDVYKIVTGEKLQAAPATLDDHEAYFVKEELYPGVKKVFGKTLQGRLTTVNQKTYDKILFFEEAGKYYLPKNAVVQTENRPLGAQAFYPLEALVLTSRPWSFRAWQANQKALFLDEARQFMRPFL